MKSAATKGKGKGKSAQPRVTVPREGNGKGKGGRAEARKAGGGELRRYTTETCGGMKSAATKGKDNGNGAQPGVTVPPTA